MTGADLETATGRRLQAVTELELLDHAGDPVLTALTRLAQCVTGAPAAALHIFDATCQHRIAASGVPLLDHPLDDSMCKLVLLGGSTIVTSDATKDGRFDYSTFVSGETPVRFYASVPVTVGGGVVVGTLCAFGPDPHTISDEQTARLQDIASVARAHLELSRSAAELGSAAARDTLTGVFNRGVFDNRLTQALARHRRHGKPLLVCMIDFDEFKAINDEHGHAAGDAALRWVASRLLARVRAEDTVGRLGGDEFAIVAELADHGAGALVEQLTGAPDGFEPAFTISVGAVLAEPADTAESVLARADRAMYEVKRSRAARRAAADGAAR